jgi:acyl carrier protein
MRLGLIELTYAIEEEFKINISNETAETLTTPKTVIDFVHSQVDWKFTREQVTEKFWQILVFETGIDQEKFDEDSRFVEDMELD